MFKTVHVDATPLLMTTLPLSGQLCWDARGQILGLSQTVGNYVVEQLGDTVMMTLECSTVIYM